MYQKIRYLFLIVIIYFGACGIRGNENGNSADPGSQTYTDIFNDDVEIIGLLYHRFDEQKYPSTSISKKLFREQMGFLKVNKFNVITFSEAIRKIRSVDEKGRFIVITIDDAFNSFMDNGFPILQEFGFKATLFVNTETVGSNDYLNWTELHSLIENGIEIGNHTHSHDYFLNMEVTLRHDAFIRDVNTAQNIIIEKLEITPEVFAYPFGEYDIQMKNNIKKMGFIGAAAQNSGVMSGYSDPYALPRFPMTDLYGKMPVFKEKISMKALPVLETVPQSTIALKNPPVLEIKLDNIDLEFGQMQCFIQGGKCNITLVNDTNIHYRLTSDRALTSRRHLYTITIPDHANKNWYWYSYQWIFPGIK